MTASSIALTGSAVALLLTSAQPTQVETPSAKPSRDFWVDLGGGLRVNQQRQAVEFPGFIPVDVHDPATPIVYLETIVCAVDSKEHESLVATTIRPSQVHAALLTLGLEPGSPGSWAYEDNRPVGTPPTGPALRIEIVHENTSVDASEWVVAENGGQFQSDGFVFAGSRFAEVPGGERYVADADGIIVGLHTFGSEVIAQRRILHHDAGFEEPEWIASGDLPPFGAEVTVRISVDGGE